MSTSPAPPASETLGLLRNPRFLIYVAIRFSFNSLTRMLVVVIGWHVYELTSNPVHLGYVGLAMFLPVLATGLFAGDIADRVNRAGIVMFGAFAAFVAAAGLVLVAQLPEPGLWIIYAATVVFGTALAMSRPALWALLPRIVVPEHMPAAVNIATVAGQVATIAGPALAGFLLVGSLSLGYGGIALMALACGFLGFTLLPAASKKVEGEEAEEGQSTLDRMLAGVRYIRHTPVILGMVMLDLFAVLLGSVVVLLPVFARDILDVGPAGLGILRAAPAVGASLAALVLVRAMPKNNAGMAILSFTVLFGLCAVVFALSQNFWLSFAALFVGGAADMVSVVMRHSVLQLGTPDALRGRVNAASQVAISASNEVGDFRAGLVASWIGAVPAAVVGGVCTVLVVAGCAWIFPSLRRLSDPRKVAAEANAAHARRTG